MSGGIGGNTPMVPITPMTGGGGGQLNHLVVASSPSTAHWLDPSSPIGDGGGGVSGTAGRNVVKVLN